MQLIDESHTIFFCLVNDNNNNNNNINNNNNDFRWIRNTNLGNYTKPIASANSGRQEIWFYSMHFINVHGGKPERF